MTKEECYEILKEMKLNKTPGNDGFSVEFYCTFWPVLGDMLINALNVAYDKRELSNSQKQGVITLIEKEGKDVLYVKNYRPITLLNVDYKILSKVLAKRIKEVLGEIIHFDQVGYIKGRNIGEAVRLIDDMLFHSLTQPTGFLVAVDFEKAFDSVSHKFLFEALKLFGFGHSFCTWVQILYNDISSCVMNGGHSTGYFGIKRGVRQGDPLSPYLFLIAIEILALTTRKDVNVKGIKFGNYEVKQVLYADDITILAKDTSSVERLRSIFEAFEKISGLRVNKEKTNFMWMGNEFEMPGIPTFGNLVNEVKILGVYFTRNIKKKDNLNYKEILSKIKKLLGWWKQRDLTIMGKIQLLKTYALSKLNFVSSLISVPRWVCEEVEKISFEFVWGGKDRIKRKILYQNYEFGGLSMSNFKIFIKTQRVLWLKRLLYGEHNSGWKLYFDYCCNLVGGRFIFLCDYDIAKMELKDLPPFYVEILEAWQDMGDCRNFENDKLNPILFNNRRICLRNKMVFDNELFQKGVIQVFDILDGTNMKPLTHFWSLGLKSRGLMKIYDLYRTLLNEMKDGINFNNFMKVDIQNYNIEIKVLGNKINMSEMKSKVIYSYFIQKFRNEIRLQIRDGHNNFDYNCEELKNIFLRLRSATLCNKQREFQFKMLHGAVYTKEHLYKFGFVQDDRCSFCLHEVETYSHLFFDCIKVQQLWQEVGESLHLNELRNRNWNEIFVGLPGRSYEIKCVNTIIFLIKYIIFIFRTQGKLPSIQIILKKILEYEKEERKLAVQKGKLGIHLQKWEQVNLGN